MDIVKLRTLTLKSKAFFYSDPNWTIEKLINDKPYKVIKTYYEQEKISFNQEVLDILKEKFPNFIEIEKPSKLSGWNEIVFQNNFENFTYARLLKLHRYLRAKKGVSNNFILKILKKKKSELIRTEAHARMTISNKELQGKNHGR